MKQPPAETLGHEPSQRPWKLSLRLLKYMISQRLKGHKQVPPSTMLELLKMWNLSCVDSGPIREYKAVMNQITTVESGITAS